MSAPAGSRSFAELVVIGLVAAALLRRIANPLASATPEAIVDEAACILLEEQLA